MRFKVRNVTLFAAAVSPEKVTISGQRDAKAGDTIRLSCVSAISNPPTVITWFTRGRPLTGSNSSFMPSAQVTTPSTFVLYHCSHFAFPRRRLVVIGRGWLILILTEQLHGDYTDDNYSCRHVTVATILENKDKTPADHGEYYSTLFLN